MKEKERRFDSGFAIREKRIHSNVDIFDFEKIN